MDEYPLLTSENEDSDDFVEEFHESGFSLVTSSAVNESWEELPLISDEDEFPVLSSDTEAEDLNSSEENTLDTTENISSRSVYCHSSSELEQDVSEPSTTAEKRNRQSCEEPESCVPKRKAAFEVGIDDDSSSSSASDFGNINEKRRKKTNKEGIASISSLNIF